MTDHQRLCIVAGGMDLPKMPWIWASSAVRGEKELPAHDNSSETRVHVCLGALLWVRHGQYVVQCSHHQLCVPAGAGAWVRHWVRPCRGWTVGLAALVQMVEVKCAKAPWLLFLVKTSLNPKTL